MNFYTDVYSTRDKIYLRGIMDGQRYKEEIDYRPFIFLPNNKGSFRTLKNKPVEKKYFETIQKAKQFIKTNSEVTNSEWHGSDMFMYQFINSEFGGELDFDLSQIRTITLDIEVEHENGFPDMDLADREILSIVMEYNDSFLVFGTKIYIPKSDNVRYIKCKDEIELLHKFLAYWNSDEWCPDVVTGWNVIKFDIKYLVNRLKTLFGENIARYMSPWKNIREKEIKTFNNKTEIIYDLPGIQLLDYLDLYKKFTFKNHESYKLDSIAFAELGDKKVEYGEYGNLMGLYKQNFELFIDYNIKDCALVRRLNNRLGFLEQVFTLAYDAKVNYVDTMTTVRIWDVIITNYLLSKNKVVSPFSPSEEYIDIMGGYVKEPKIGLSKWVVSFDFTSLYPHLIMAFNISPETFNKRVSLPSIDTLINDPGSLSKYTEFAKNYNFSLTGNGCLFHNGEHGFLPELMDKMFKDRVEYKGKMLAAKKAFEATKDSKYKNEISKWDNLQKARKIQLNAAYGALANRYFRFFSSDIAESVTSSGQFAIKFCEKKMNAYLNKILKTENVDYIIAADTDSLYITLDDLVNKYYKSEENIKEIVEFLDKFCKEKLEPYIIDCLKEFGEKTNMYDQRLYMKREAIANKGIWRGAKMYILNVYNNEGVAYKEPDLVMHGIEAVRSSTPYIVRQKIKECLKIVMNGTETEFQKFVADFRELFYTLPFEDVASPRSVNKLNQYKEDVIVFGKGTPIQVKGALVYNNLIDKLNLDNKYELIYDGTKIKFVYLLLPNPARCNVISCPGTLPPEFGLEKYINYDLQFSKTFIDPICSITGLINWSTAKRNRLGDLYE